MCLFFVFFPPLVLIEVSLISWFNSLSGVPRETEKEKDFADFDIFDDPETPFSTFNFQYSNEAFTRLHDLMEFNTLNNLEVGSPPRGWLWIVDNSNGFF